MWEDQPDTSRILRKAVTDKGLSEAAAVPQWGLWWVSPVGHRQQTTVDDLRVIQASAQAWKERDYELDTYQPLVRYPDLFLRFARLAEDGGLDGGWDEWPQTDKNARVAKSGQTNTECSASPLRKSREHGGERLEVVLKIPCALLLARRGLRTAFCASTMPRTVLRASRRAASGRCCLEFAPPTKGVAWA